MVDLNALLCLSLFSPGLNCPNYKHMLMEILEEDVVISALSACEISTFVRHVWPPRPATPHTPISVAERPERDDTEL